MVLEQLEDLVKVVVDYNLSSKENRPNINTGKYVLIHKAKKVEEVNVASGFNLICKGSQLNGDNIYY